MLGVRVYLRERPHVLLKKQDEQLHLNGMAVRGSSGTLEVKRNHYWFPQDEKEATGMIRGRERKSHTMEAKTSSCNDTKSKIGHPKLHFTEWSQEEELLMQHIWAACIMAMACLPSFLACQKIWIYCMCLVSFFLASCSSCSVSSAGQ